MAFLLSVDCLRAQLTPKLNASSKTPRKNLSFSFFPQLQSAPDSQNSLKKTLDNAIKSRFETRLAC